MSYVKCDNCNHVMIRRKDFFECPMCHNKMYNENFTIAQKNELENVVEPLDKDEPKQVKDSEVKSGVVDEVGKEQQINQEEPLTEETKQLEEKSENEDNDSVKEAIRIYENNCLDQDYDNEEIVDDLDDSAQNTLNNDNNVADVDNNIRQAGIDAYNNLDYVQALHLLSKCDKDSEVNYYLGCIHWYQQPEQDSLIQAYNYFMNSDDLRSAELLNDMGKRFYLGDGCSADLEKAFSSFMKSASLGCDKAMSNVAMCYKKGSGVDMNMSLAAEYYKKSADNGNIVAMYEFANICLYENDLIDESLGIEYLTKSANNNFAKAQYLLGVCYYKGNGVSEDYFEAQKWIDRAIANGSKEAKDFQFTYLNNNLDYSNNNCALESDNLDDLDI